MHRLKLLRAAIVCLSLWLVACNAINSPATRVDPPPSAEVITPTLLPMSGETMTPSGTNTATALITPALQPTSSETMPPPSAPTATALITEGAGLIPTPELVTETTTLPVKRCSNEPIQSIRLRSDLDSAFALSDLRFLDEDHLELVGWVYGPRGIQDDPLDPTSRSYSRVLQTAQLNLLTGEIVTATQPINHWC
jgi:hypothetical protein